MFFMVQRNLFKPCSLLIFAEAGIGNYKDLYKYRINSANFTLNSILEAPKILDLSSFVYNPLFIWYIVIIKFIEIKIKSSLCKNQNKTNWPFCSR